MWDVRRLPNGRAAGAHIRRVRSVRYHKHKIRAVLQLVRGISSFVQGGSYFRPNGTGSASHLPLGTPGIEERTT